MLIEAQNSELIQESTKGATLRHVARRAGIGVGTASRVFSGNGNVSQHTREAVLQAARELDYSIHPAARALATGKNQVIALWARGLFTPFYASIVGAMQARTAQDKYRLLIDDVNGRKTMDEMQPAQWPVDGIIALSSLRQVDFYLQMPRATQRPIVSIGHYCNARTDTVQLELSAAADDAMRHLLASGRKNIVYLNSESSFEGDVRNRAYGDAMREAGLPAARVTVPNVLVQNGRSMARAFVASWLRGNPMPQAFFCWNDDIAVATYRALCDVGARVPDDVALVGCDGIEETQFFETPISTLVTPFDAMCAAAWELLRRRMDEPTAPVQHLTLPLRFEARASSGGSSTLVASESRLKKLPRKSR